MTYITRIGNKRILAKYFLYSLQINYLHCKLSASRSIFSCYATNFVKIEFLNQTAHHSLEMKTRLHSTKIETRALKLQLKRPESKLSEMVERNGVILEEELSADMCKVMDENDCQLQQELIVLRCTVALKPQQGKGDGWSYRAQPHADRTPGLGF